MPRPRSENKNRFTRWAARKNIGDRCRGGLRAFKDQRWPEVLTLAEAAAYLRVSETELARVAGSQGPPGRLIGSEWRSSRAALQDWLRRPSMKDSLLQLAEAWRDDPYLDDMLGEIYRQRGRPMTEEAT